ncbi:MAG: methyl-accepting chemotaxis protein, partial [Spirochaetota bacterium]
PKMIIAQPCPAIVTYIQLYKKELLEHLAPAHSPMLHTISMIREYFPEYAGHATAVLSPCLAKKREFEETGLGDYNVTYKSIDAHLSEKRIDLDRYPEMEFAGPKAERAVLFSSPGGLMRTAGRDAPEIPSRTRKIEGTHAIYPYLRSLPESVRKGVNPLLVDCLNCEAGCNGGPGTLTKNLPLDEIEAAVEARMREARKEYVGTFFDGKDAHAKRKVGKVLSDYWKEGIYGRNYRDLSSFYRIKTPGKKELEAIYADMKKETDEDILNCAACGYNSCEMMATAIFNGLNKPENCHLYRNKVIQESHEMTGRISSKLHDEIDASRRLLESVKTHMGSIMEKCENQHAFIMQSSAVIEQMVRGIRKSTDLSNARQSSISELTGYAESGEQDMSVTVRAIGNVNESVRSIGQMIEVLNDVASRTNLLGMNAAIEAAHAGDSGKGFAVVASEIRKLAETSRENSASISKTLQAMIEEISSTSEISKKTGENIHAIIDYVKDVAESFRELVTSMNEMAAGSSQVSGSLEDLKVMAEEMKSSQQQMAEAVGKMQGVIENINAISHQNLESLNGAAAGTEEASAKEQVEEL